MTLLGCVGVPLAAPSGTSDPCDKVVEKAFVPSADVLACYKSFPFNETIRESTDRRRPRDSTVNIRAELKRIGSTKYKLTRFIHAHGFNFNHDLYNLPHAVWLSNCYGVYENLLPAPITTFKQKGAEGICIVPNLDHFIPLLGSNFTGYYEYAKFDWKRLAGARVVEIEGKDPYAYAECVTHAQSGNYLDHGVRVNSVFNNHWISGTSYSQRIGDLAGSVFPGKDTLMMKTNKIPWAKDCTLNAQTNGVDYKNTGEMENLVKRSPERTRKMTRVSRIDKQKVVVDLPSQLEPAAPKLNGSEGSYVLPDGKTGVLFVSLFEPDDVNAFMTDIQTAFMQFKPKGVSQLPVDLTNNDGGYVCLGQFLLAFLVGKNLGDFKNP
ncbi:hypothetical protein V8D89_013831 [Ganoderma adspersum]